MKQDIRQYPLITSTGKKAKPRFDKYSRPIKDDENAFREAVL